MQTRTISPEIEQQREDFLAEMLPLKSRLAQYARGVSRTREEAEDLVGDTILAALEGFGRLRDRGHFRGFLFRIASRIHRRKRWRARLFGAWDADSEASIPSTGTAPDAAADVEALHRALASLPDQQREAVVLFEISGLSLEEIRSIQGGTISAVKSRVSRGRQRLAELLGADEGHVRARRDVSRRIAATLSETALIGSNSDG